jgi:hypothetical protein
MHVPVNTESKTPLRIRILWIRIHVHSTGSVDPGGQNRKEIACFEELYVFFRRPFKFNVNGINFLIFFPYFLNKKPGPGSGSTLIKTAGSDPDLNSINLDHQGWPKLGRKHNL